MTHDNVEDQYLADLVMYDENPSTNDNDSSLQYNVDHFKDNVKINEDDDDNGDEEKNPSMKHHNYKEKKCRDSEFIGSDVGIHVKPTHKGRKRDQTSTRRRRSDKNTSTRQSDRNKHAGGGGGDDAGGGDYAGHFDDDGGDGNCGGDDNDTNDDVTTVSKHVDKKIKLEKTNGKDIKQDTAGDNDDDDDVDNNGEDDGIMIHGIKNHHTSRASGTGYNNGKDADDVHSVEDEVDDDDEINWPIHDMDGSPLQESYNLPDAFVHNQYVFRSDSIDPIEWKRHCKILCFPLIETFMQKKMRLRYRGKQQFMNSASVSNDQQWYAVPPRYGIVEFGIPAKDLRWNQKCEKKMVFRRELWGAKDNLNQQMVAPIIIQRMKMRGCGGILELPTGTGKSELAAYIGCHFQMRMLVVCHSSVALEQHWPDTFRDSCPDLHVESIVGHGTIKAKHLESIMSADVLLVMMQSCSMKPYPIQIMQRFPFGIIDEIHRAGASGMSKLFPNIGQRQFIIGLTGTRERRTGTDRIFDWWIGPTLYRAPKSTKVSCATRILPVLYSGGEQVRVMKFVRELDGTTKPETDFNKTADALCKDPKRNRLLLWYIRRLLRDGRRGVIFAYLVQHLAWLQDACSRDIKCRFYVLLANTTCPDVGDINDTPSWKRVHNEYLHIRKIHRIIYSEYDEDEYDHDTDTHTENDTDAHTENNDENDDDKRPSMKKRQSSSSSSVRSSSSGRQSLVRSSSLTISSVLPSTSISSSSSGRLSLVRSSSLTISSVLPSTSSSSSSSSLSSSSSVLSSSMLPSLTSSSSVVSSSVLPSSTSSSSVVSSVLPSSSVVSSLVVPSTTSVLSSSVSSSSSSLYSSSNVIDGRIQRESHKRTTPTETKTTMIRSTRKRIKMQEKNENGDEHDSRQINLKRRRRGRRRIGRNESMPNGPQTTETMSEPDIREEERRWCMFHSWSTRVDFVHHHIAFSMDTTTTPSSVDELNHSHVRKLHDNGHDDPYGTENNDNDPCPIIKQCVGSSEERANFLAEWIVAATIPTNKNAIIDHQLVHFNMDIPKEDRPEFIRIPRCFLFATYNMLSTGVNIRWMNSAIGTFPRSDYITVSQVIGRFRPSIDGRISQVNFPLFIDIVDTFAPWAAHFQKRKIIYRDKKCVVLPHDVIYSNSDLMEHDVVTHQSSSFSGDDAPESKEDGYSNTKPTIVSAINLIATRLGHPTSLIPPVANKVLKKKPVTSKKNQKITGKKSDKEKKSQKQVQKDSPKNKNNKIAISPSPSSVSPSPTKKKRMLLDTPRTASSSPSMSSTTSSMSTLSNGEKNNNKRPKKKQCQNRGMK